jgi:opacity protein-like surface antigen
VTHVTADVHDERQGEGSLLLRKPLSLFEEFTEAVWVAITCRSTSSSLTSSSQSRAYAVRATLGVAVRGRASAYGMGGESALGGRGAQICGTSALGVLEESEVGD